MRNATQLGFRPGLLEELLKPWVGSEGQAAYYRQYSQLRQADTAEYEHRLGRISIPVGSCGAATTGSSRRNMVSGSPRVFRMLR